MTPPAAAYLPSPHLNPSINKSTGVLRNMRISHLNAMTPPSPENNKSDGGLSAPLLKAELLYQNENDDYFSPLVDDNNTSPKSEAEALSTTLSQTTSTISSILLLNVVTIIWGTQHAVIKMVLMDDTSSTAGFTFCRFLLALIISSVYTPSLSPVFRKINSLFKERREEVDDVTLSLLNVEDGGTEEVSDVMSDCRREESDEEVAVSAWRWGVELGMWMFLGYAFQAIALEFTTAQRSGFLLYLNVKFVPFFAFLLLGRKITIPTWISALIALFGTALLSYDGSPINIGDIWSIAAAAASAMFILRMESASVQVSSASALNAACLWTVTTAASLWLIIESSINSGGSVATVLLSPYESVVTTIQSHPLAIFYLGFVTTALANYVQTKAQRGITAERASIIYAMDPVYGAVFAYWILGETLGVQGMIGAFFICVAAATNAFLDLGEKR